MESQPSETPPLPPRPRKISRPKLNIPTINLPQAANPKSPVVHIPMSAGCAIPIGNANGPFGLLHFYPSKASEFMNKKYAGFKDFTKNTAKAGLSFGEKSLFWLNGRIRHLSKRWFTHIFLFLVVFSYSVLGALLFVTVEGTHEEKERAEVETVLNTFVFEVQRLAKDEEILSNASSWDEEFRKALKPYQEVLLESYKDGFTPKEHKTWSFWNSVFYCGTIYTTIGQYSIVKVCLLYFCNFLI